MKLTDKTFYTERPQAVERKVSAQEIRAAFSQTDAYNQAFDLLAQINPQVVDYKSDTIGGAEAWIISFNDGAKMYVDDRDGAILVTPNGESTSFYGAGPDNPYDAAQYAYFQSSPATMTGMTDMEKQEWIDGLHPNDPEWALGGIQFDEPKNNPLPDHESQAGGPMSQPGPGMEPPLDQKIQDLKGKGLNDQQVEEVIKIGQLGGPVTPPPAAPHPPFSVDPQDWQEFMWGGKDDRNPTSTIPPYVMLRDGSEYSVVSWDAGGFELVLGEDLNAKVYSDLGAQDLGAFLMGAVEAATEHEGSAPVQASDGTQPDGTANRPVHDEKAPLYTEEIEGTGKIGGNILSLKMAQVVGDPPPELDEKKLDEAAPPVPDEDKPKDVKDLMGPEKGVEDKKLVVQSFLRYVEQLHQKWSAMYNEIADAKVPNYTPFTFRKDNPPSKAEQKALQAEKQMLRKRLQILQVQISKAGSMYKRLVKLLGADMPKDILLDWLQKETAQRPDRSTMTPVEKTPAVIPADQPITKVQVKAQVPPPPKPPAAPPPPGGAPAAPPADPNAPPMGEPPMDGMEEEMLPDDRTLEEVLSDLKTDMEVLEQKVESGETILDGQDVEPIHDDAGSLPAPPGKIAVDQPAKEYYHDLYGEFGDQLTRDRVAEIMDVIDEVSAVYKTALTTDQIKNVVEFLDSMESVPAASLYARAAMVGHSHAEFADTVDRIMVNFMVKNGSYAESIDTGLKSAMFVIATNANPKVKQSVFKYLEAADPKMKSPKVKKQPDDAVKIDKLEDVADEGEHMLARPAHLPMHTETSRLSGEYVVMELSWDPDHPAAVRSSNGMEQAVVSHMKGLESIKEFRDLGYCGEFNIVELDIEAGFAEIRFKSRRISDAPLHVTNSPEKKKAQAAPAVPKATEAEDPSGDLSDTETSTEVRSPTSTEAETTGNFTLTTTGGAGDGANTYVFVNLPGYGDVPGQAVASPAKKKDK